MTTDFPHSLPIWRFLAPLGLQIVLIVAIPAQAIYTQFTGKTVVLQTAPVDPYELLRGYSQTLNYDISRQDRLRKLPGWQELPQEKSEGNEVTFIKPGTHFYVILQAPTSIESKGLPKAWKPVAVSLKYPSQLSKNQVAIKGLAQFGFIQYGLETYYIPEDQREQINADLRAAQPERPTTLQQTLLQANPIQQPPRPPVVMKIKVNAKGEAVPISLCARVSKTSKQQEIRCY
ncbi:MAG TPA: GDYXXLXY domain-containing protein [Coleofasciculaceae cyanobacterium]